MMTLRSLKLLFVSLLLLSGASALAQQAPTAPTAPKAPDTPAAFSFFIESNGFLGVHTEDINTENMGSYGLQREPRGVGVKKVVPNSPAERAGLRERDVILRFEKEPVTSVRKLNRLISEVAPEHTVRLTIIRDGDEKELTATLGKRSDFNTATVTPSFRLEDFDKLKDKMKDFNFDDKNNFTFVYGNNRRIGVTTTQLTKQLADYFGIAGGKGLLITSVRENSPAAKAGLRAGDVITEADGQSTGTVADLMRALSSKEEGEITLTITRDKSQRTIRLTPERSKAFDAVMPEVFHAPQAMQIALPKIEVEMPKIVIPAMPKVQMPIVPKVVVPAIRVNVAPKVLTLPSTPL
ncbi:MAG TPA: PDZ domain-containing protein [Pyrinomonadaceae bacterium]|jgi:serine protease Do